MNLLETKLSGVEVYCGHFLTAYKDVVALPDGTSAVREYLVHPGAVMVVPLLLDQSGIFNVVLERQFRYPMGRTMVEFPAGKLDAGEQVFDCARRELQEETGFSAKQWAHAGRINPVIAYSTEFIDIWFARHLVSGVQHLDAGEFVEVFSVSPSTLMQWCMDGTITDAKTICGALWLQNMLNGSWTPAWQSVDLPG